MKLDVDQMRNEAAFLGDKIWICHYNRPDLNKKPLRNIPPTEVIVRTIDELPKNKRVYYSHVFFSPISKSGNPKAAFISPVDNTGYRSSPGNNLHAFDNREECVREWNEQLNQHITRIEKKAAIASIELAQEAKKLKDLKI